MKIGRLLLRVLVGGFFVGHGTQKLFGWFGGSGLAATGEYFEQLGLRPGRAHATAAGLSEAGGGAALAAGVQTPLAAAAITATMLTAIRTVHLKNGPWSSNGGYEYNAVLIAAALLLAELGPGPLSIDGARGREHAGTGWALAAAGAGALGAAGVALATAAEHGPSAWTGAGAGAADEPGEPVGAEPIVEEAQPAGP